ncbi:MAG: fibronectin type III domain-containing protein, partial [Acidimicrobiales bacterium]|nr:fibronectin type III domain-containing protein [Acidimicrobiales bacterium]
PPVPVPQLLSVDPGSIDIFIMWAAPSPHPPGSYEVGLRVAGGDWTVTSPDCGSCEERRAHVFDDLSCNVEYAVAIRFSDDLGRKSEWDQKEELFVC